MLTKYALAVAPYAMPIMAVLGLVVALVTADTAYACPEGSGSGGGC